MIPFSTILANPHLYCSMQIKVKGEYVTGMLVEGIRVDPSSLPDNYRFFGLRHSKDNKYKPLSAIPDKYPILNFLGTFVTTRVKPAVKKETAVEHYEYFL